MNQTKQNIQNKLYLPLKLNDDKLEYMFTSHGKIKSYKSTEALIRYSPDCDKIATYKLTSIQDIDIAEAVSEWYAAQYAYQASLQVSSSAMGMSLLNYL